MPLQQLVAYFNQRFIEEQGLANPPLRLKGQVVEGQCDGVWFGSILQPVYQPTDVSRVIAYNAALKVVDEPAHMPSSLANALASGSRTRSQDNEIPNHTVIHLDRLSRTVHMLNFLVFSHEVRSLFLQVHPRHILAVDREHGAYFEEIILRCGLSPQRIVISLPVNRAYCGQIPLLLNRLNNYRDRGYATALKFKDALGESGYTEILDQFAPDFISFDGYWLE
ncbi:MAG: EAL domain-containing protein, partial [Methylococcaceae bacterium]